MTSVFALCRLIVGPHKRIVYAAISISVLMPASPGFEKVYLHFVPAKKS